MNYIKLVSFIFSCLIIVGCGKGGGGGSGVSNDGSSYVTAPSSIAGKTLKMSITSGSGFYATTGTYTVAFSSTQLTYAVTGDGRNVVNSYGSFTYSTNGNTGVVSIIDSSVSYGSFALTFTSANGGTFVATATSDQQSTQKGNFIQL